MDSTNPGNISETVDHSSDILKLAPETADESDRVASEVKVDPDNIVKTCEAPIKMLFKKPQIGVVIGPRKGKPRQSIPEQEITVETAETLSKDDAVVTNDKTAADKLTKPSPAQRLTENNIPIPYKEPKWCGYPKVSYKFEVLKSGKILEHYDLTSRSCHVFGRLPNCDVTLLHPTISRHHAVVQYRSQETAEYPVGFYVYDLQSTHGTFLNKNKIKPNIYVRLHVGHILKFGCSTRLYLLQGPTEDEEEESELTVTQIQAQRQNELLKRKLEKLQGILPEEEDDGISWGMGDDADEETDLSVNPFAATTNEELYLDDPKKTLRGWFEREGHDLEYDVQEKGAAQFLCVVELPVESARGGVVIAEALVKGKKKEAVVQCALEACRILDRYGLLRQANHESKKRKAKDWEAEDFYDSDDDTFLDRTGSVEKKRKQRMQSAGPREVLTYNTLVDQHATVLTELNANETQLDEAIAKKNATADAKKRSQDEDDLDAFMTTLANPAPDKLHISKLKSSLIRLKAEEQRLRKLVNLARPANLPELKPQAADNTPTTVGSTAANKMAALIGKTRKLAKSKQGNIEKESRELNLKEEEGKEEVDEKEESDNEEVNDKDENKDEEIVEKRIEKVEEIEEEEQKMEVVENTEKNLEMMEREAERRRKKNRKRMQQRNAKTQKDQTAKLDAIEASDPDYSDWAPPEGQTGDGRTTLNDRLGY